MATAHWGKDSGWWRWSDSSVETTAFAILALTTIDPKSPLIEPSVNWLLKNRRGAQWTNTRDTALSVMALTQYLKTSGELSGPVEYALTVNGHEVARKKLSREEIIAAPSRFVVSRRQPASSRPQFAIRTRAPGGHRPALLLGGGALLLPGGADHSLRPRAVRAAPLLLKQVPRKTLLKGWVYDRLPLNDNGQVESGDRIEVVITVETKNDYDYLLFEDLKPAGLRGGGE